MRAKNPLCYNCGEKRAKPLLGDPACFCSIRCAARCALDSVFWGGEFWCEKHKMWSGKDTKECPFCENEDKHDSEA